MEIIPHYVRALLIYAVYMIMMVADDLSTKLDESTARRQLKSPRSLSGRFIHLTLVTKWLWSWSWMTYCHPLLCNVNRPSHSEIQLFQNLTMKIHGQSHVCGQRSRSHLTLKIQRSRSWSRSNLMVTFEALEFNRYVCFLFRGNGTIFGWDIANSIFDLENLRSRSWQRSNPMGHIWALKSNRYVCFSFLGNRTIFGWDIANSIFDLDKSRSRSWPRSNPMVTFEP